MYVGILHLYIYTFLYIYKTLNKLYQTPERCSMSQCPRLARACIELIGRTSKQQYQSKTIRIQVNKSNIEEILMKYQHIVILLHELSISKIKEIYRILLIFDKDILFWFGHVLLFIF